MSIMRMVSSLACTISGTTVGWMKDDNRGKVSIMAFVPGSTHKMSVGPTRLNRLAIRAERIATDQAERVGNVFSTGVLMRGSGNGSIVATGIAEMTWTPDLEHRLDAIGIPQIR